MKEIKYRQHNVYCMHFQQMFLLRQNVSTELDDVQNFYRHKNVTTAQFQLMCVISGFSRSAN